MELWLLFGILGYLSYSISTSIDKYMMNKKYNIIKTETFKMFFDGIILLIIGLVFFNLNFTYNLFLWSLVLGVIYALAGIIYYNSLKLKDVEEVVPSIQSLTILLVFTGSIIIFKELVNYFNYVGVILILAGVYFVLSRNQLKIPKFDRAILLIMLIIILTTIYLLLVKKLLFNIEPINLAIMMYFSTTMILVFYQLFFKRESLSSIFQFKPKISKVMIAAFFGAIGTFLIYYALSIGNASKVYPLAGLQSVFIFIIASVFLKEKFYWKRLIGTAIVFLGIFLVSI